MNRNEIIKCIKETIGTAAGNLAKYFLKNDQELKIIIELTKFLPDNASLIDRFYYIRNNLYEIKKCKYCNNILTKNLKANFCSAKCNINYQIENTNIIEKRSKQLSINYKNKSQELKDNTKKKRKETNLRKHGVTNNLHIPDVEKNIKDTWFENMGVDNPSKSEKVKNKRKETNKERYGGSTPFHGEKQKKLRVQTWIKKYGVDNPAKNKDVQARSVATYFRKTGYHTPMQNPDVINKIRKTFFDNEGKGKHNKGYRYKIYNFASGKQILIQGYESGALDEYLLKIYNETEIENNIKIINNFDFRYGKTISGLTRKYIPDFYIKKDNLFIEIKSLYFYHKNLEEIYLKAKSVIDKGYNFYILISNDNKKFKKITYEKIKTDFENRN